MAVGFVIAAVRRRLDDPPTEVTISLLTAYAAYLPAEELGLSGVIAAVTVGVWLGWQASELTTPTTRIQLTSIWEILQFLLNAVLFVLIGLQLPVVLDALESRPLGQLALWGLVTGLLVAVVRAIWVFIATYLTRRLSARIREQDPVPAASQVTLVAWSCMRGGVCMAAALAIPLEVDAGAPSPSAT